MIGVELVEDKQTRKPASKKAAEVILRSWKRGVAIITCGSSTLRVAPPLTIQRELLDNALGIVQDVIREVEKET
jgi:4-aminobutyrate aminotransferase-like enzyme